ncbi:MAG: transposase [Hyphomicrobiales bacterium]|nr:transposase [Hyphomicrobiales bacterium]
MARIARLVVPALPHLVTQRGNRGEPVFFDDSDYLAYLDFLRDAVAVSGADIWAWCLMPNHVHLIVQPRDEDGLRKTVANAHRKYASRINQRHKWTGHLWQGRYGSVVMDEAHVYHAFAYVVLNPVRAGLVERATDWQWSSIHAHLGTDDGLTNTRPAKDRVGEFAKYLNSSFDEEDFDTLRANEQTGRPIGSADFVDGLEAKYDRVLKPKKRGPKGRG